MSNRMENTSQNKKDTDTVDMNVMIIVDYTL